MVFYDCFINWNSFYNNVFYEYAFIDCMLPNLKLINIAQNLGNYWLKGWGAILRYFFYSINDHG